MEKQTGERPRRLVVCCDGTWNSSDGGEAATNVVRMARIVKSLATDGTVQMVWYHPGVGTGNPLDRLLGGAVGIGLAPDIRAAYAFIANNYLPGDEIFLFGFSRGAYTARSVAGLIGAVGLLHEREMGRFMQVWDWSRLPPDQRNRRDLDNSFPLRSSVVPIRCIGVWDTVGALGIPPNRLLPHWHPCAAASRFYDAELGPHVQYAFQALAIDERRESFQPVLWNPARAPRRDQVIRQVWFAGVHADIGGGYEQHGAADIAFIWMAAQVAPLLELDLLALVEERDTRELYGRATLNDSYTGVFKLAGSRHRGTEPGANQYVHETALDRRGFDLYPYNPEFPFDRLPVWPRDDFERKLAWSQVAWPPSAPRLAGRKPRCCEKLVRLLEGG